MKKPWFHRNIRSRAAMGILLLLFLANMVFAQAPEIQPFKTLENVSSAAFSPDGTLLAVGGVSIRIFDAATLEEKWVLPFGGEAGAFSADNRWLALPGDPARLWDLQAQREITIPYNGDMQFSADGLAVNIGYGCQRNCGEIHPLPIKWDLQWGAIMGFAAPWHSQNGRFEFGYYANHPQHRLYAMSGSDGSGGISTSIISNETNEVIQSFNIGGPLAFNADGAVLAIPDSSQSDSVQIRLFNTETWEERAVAETEQDAVQSISFSPDNRWLTCFCGDGIVFWQVDSILPVFAKHTSVLDVSGADSAQATVNRLKYYGTVTEADHGKTIIMNNESSIWFYRTDTPHIPPKLLYQLNYEEPLLYYFVNEMAVTPDGTILVAGVPSHTVTLWDVRTGVRLYELKVSGVSAIPLWVLSPDGAQVVMVDRMGWDVHVWDVHSGAEIFSVQADAGETFEALEERGTIQKIAFSNDGRLLAVASLFYEGGPSFDRVRVFDVATGEKIALFISEGGSQDVELRFSADGATINYGQASWQVPE